MNEQHPLLIFDYDGTIHQTHIIYEPAILKAVWLLNREHNLSLEQPKPERIKSWLGMRTEEMWEDFAPFLPQECRVKAGKYVGEIMRREILQGHGCWYPGMEEVLDTLKMQGYRMIILSNCDEAYAKVNWQSFRMSRWFDAFVDCGSYPGKSKGEILQKILQKESCKATTFAKDFYMVGDRANDMEAGRGNGMCTIGCLYGYGTKQELAQADQIIERPDSLLELLL